MTTKTRRYFDASGVIAGFLGLTTVFVGIILTILGIL